MTDPHAPHWKAILVTLASATAVVVAFLSLIYAVSTNRSKTLDNGDLVQQVQRSRAASLLDDCKDQNRRNLATVKVIGQQVTEYAPIQRAQARIRATEAIQIVNALAPVRDCEAIVTKRIVLH